MCAASESALSQANDETYSMISVSEDLVSKEFVVYAFDKDNFGTEQEKGGFICETEG